MAQGDVVVNVVVNSANAAKNIGEIKQSIKDMQKLLANKDIGGEQFNKLTKAIAEAKGKLGDLNTSIKQSSGSGIEKLNTSFGLFAEGVNNFDPGKIKASLSGIGAAMKAIPIFLILEGIRYLSENFDKLKASGGLLGKTLTFISDVMEELGNFAEWLGDKIGIVDLEMNKLSDSVDKYGKASEELLKKQNAEWDQNIKLASASGKSTVEAEILKQEAIKKTNMQLALNLKYLEASGRELTDKQKEQLSGYMEAVKSASNEIAVIQAKDEKDRETKAKERDAKNKEANKKKLEEAKKLQADEADRMNAAIDKEEADAKKLAERRAKDLEDLKALSLKRDQEEVAEFMAKEAELKKIQDQAVADHKASEAAKKEATVAGLNAAQSLSQAFFAIQLNRAKGNAEAELKIKKRMFEVDKAFNVARAIQDGIRSVQAALTIPPPGGQILAVVNAGLAAANVAKILATKFEGGSVADIGVPTANVSTNAPNINTNAPTTQAAQSTTTTRLGEDGQNLGQRVYVLESDISKSQNRVARLNEQATV